ncbi:hypothetical protein pb186bvf_005915 [Paramecium bursaria]
MKRLSLITSSIYQVSNNKYDNFGKILYLNGLLMVNISFGMAATQIIPEIAEQMDYNGLGQLIVLLQYVVSMIGNIISPWYLKKVAYRWSFFFLAFQGCMQCLCGIYISYAKEIGLGKGLTYFGAIVIASINGICYGGLWVAQNLYISENANDSNRALFFGVSNSLSNSAGMIGSLVSYFFIGPLGPFKYFSLLFVLTFLTQLLYLFVLQPPGHEMKTEVKEVQVELNLQGNVNEISLVKQPQRFRAQSEQINSQMIEKSQRSNSYGSIVDQKETDDIIQSKIEERKKILHKTKQEYEVVEFFHELPVKQQIAMILDVAKSDKIRPIIPYMIATGVVLGFEYGVYYKLITQAIVHTYPLSTTSDVQTKSFIVFGAQGISEIFGGLSIGWLGQKYLINYSSIIQSSWIHITLFVILANCFILNFNVCIVFAFMWGFADCAGQANCMSLLSEEWGDDVRVFGLYNFAQNVGALSAILISLQ